VTDPNGKVGSTSYNNRLLGAVDPFARPGVVTDPQGRTTITRYFDNARKSEVWSDLNSPSDARLRSRASADQLGRAIKTETSEEGGLSYGVFSDTVYQQAGRITIKTWAKDDRVYCSVTDTGAGMPEEVRRRALEPFFTTKGPKATGLGLSVAYGTVQRYGGTLTVESTEGQGTTVEVSLPTASAATAISKTTTAAPKAPALPLRILVIDDELQVRSTLAEMLEEQGHSVTQAPGGREGLSYLESNPELVDVVISDLGMPDMTGWDVAAAIQERWPGLPVGLITGWGETEITREERSRVNFVITKPFDKAVLRETMSDIRPRS